MPTKYQRESEKQVTEISTQGLIKKLKELNPQIDTNSVRRDLFFLLNKDSWLCEIVVNELPKNLTKSNIKNYEDFIEYMKELSSKAKVDEFYDNLKSKLGFCLDNADELKKIPSEYFVN